MKRPLLLHGDCLVTHSLIPDASVDLIYTDLPYGVTACNWDKRIDLPVLWEQYKRLLKPNGVVALHASQPFTSDIIQSNRDWFKYCWYWEKSRGGNFALTGHQPLKVIEEICVFATGAAVHTLRGTGMPYYPQKTRLESPYKRVRSKDNSKLGFMEIRGTLRTGVTHYDFATPRNLLYASVDGDGRMHPTQKPVALAEYMIRTYTNEGDTVLDSCAGSFTTGIGCLNTRRNCILIESDKTFFDAGCKRIEQAERELSFRLFHPAEVSK